MKALTIHQPYPSLIMDGKKRYETRSWKTSYRGLLAIHASKKWDGKSHQYCNLLKRNYKLLSGWPLQPLPIGAVLGIVRLVDIHPVEEVQSIIARQEWAVGDYVSGYAWELEVVHKFDLPIPTKGYQGLWNWYPPLDEMWKQIEDEPECTLDFCGYHANVSATSGGYSSAIYINDTMIATHFSINSQRILKQWAEQIIGERINDGG